MDADELLDGIGTGYHFKIDTWLSGAPEDDAKAFLALCERYVERVKRGDPRGVARVADVARSQWGLDVCGTTLRVWMRANCGLP